MSLIKGYVEKIWENAIPAKGGRKAFTSYAVVVDNVKYGTFTKPKCSEGDYVEFQASQKGQYWNLDIDSLKLATPAADTPKPAPASTGYGKSAATQDAINYQAARKAAFSIIDLMIKLEILDLGTKKGDKIENLEKYVDRYTERFFEDTKNLGHKPADSTDATTEEEPFNDEIPY